MNELFPIGSIVTVSGHEGPVMIMGYYQHVNNHLYDYIGVPYPKGLVSTKSTLVFDHNALELLVSRGYEDEEGEKFFKELPNLIASVAAYHEAQKGE